MDPEQILALTAGVVTLFVGLVWFASSLTRPPKEFTADSIELHNDNV